MDEPPRPARTYIEPDPAGPIPRRSGTDPATDAQLRKLRAMMRGTGVDNWSPPEGFTKADASALIDELTAELAGKGDQ